MNVIVPGFEVAIKRQIILTATTNGVRPTPDVTCPCCQTPTTLPDPWHHAGYTCPHCRATVAMLFRPSRGQWEFEVSDQPTRVGPSHYRASGSGTGHSASSFLTMLGSLDCVAGVVSRSCLRSAGWPLSARWRAARACSRLQIGQSSCRRQNESGKCSVFVGGAALTYPHFVHVGGRQRPACRTVCGLPARGGRQQRSSSNERARARARVRAASTDGGGG